MWCEEIIKRRMVECLLTLNAQVESMADARLFRIALCCIDEGTRRGGRPRKKRNVVRDLIRITVILDNGGRRMICERT